MKFTVFFLGGIIFLNGWISNAQAAITKDGYAACWTKADYDELMQMASRRDQRGFSHMMDSGKCLPLKGGLEVSVVKDGIFSKQIRVYVGKHSETLWVQSEAIR